MTATLPIKGRRSRSRKRIRADRPGPVVDHQRALDRRGGAFGAGVAVSPRPGPGACPRSRRSRIRRMAASRCGSAPAACGSWPGIFPSGGADRDRRAGAAQVSDGGWGGRSAADGWIDL